MKILERLAGSSAALTLCLVPLTLVATAGSSDPGGERPRELIAHTTQVVEDAILSEELSEPEKRSRVQNVLDKAVDFPTTSKLILARNFKKFTPEQRERFVEAFRKHLMFTYWKNASTAEFDRIEITGDRKEARKDWTVKTNVVQGSDRTTMDYRLRLFGDDDGAPGEWRIIDLTIEGVSLVSNFRSQFQSIVSDSGPDGLLRLLEKKNAEAEKEGR